MSDSEHDNNKPVTIEVLANKTYLWCACGRSRTQPLCDGSHQGTGVEPVRIQVAESGYMKLCMCKKTRKPPYCDDSHLEI